MSIRVAQINSVARGSTGSIAVGLARAMQAEGIENRIFYGRGDAPSDVSAVRFASASDVYGHVLKTRLFDAHGFASKRSTRRLIAMLEDFAPDVVHLHNLHGYYVNLPMLFRYLKRKALPVIWTFHDFWPITGHCAHFSVARCDRWQNACFDCPQKGGYPSSFIKDNSAINFRKKKRIVKSIKRLSVVAVSNWCARLLKQSFLDE